MWKREGRAALPRPAATWAADTVVSRCSDTAHEWSARRRIAESLSAAVGILGRHLSRSSYIRSQIRTPGERRQRNHVVLSFRPRWPLWAWAPQIFVREDRCPSLSVPCPAHVRLSLQAPGRVEVAGRCADQRRWRCLPSSNHPVPQINPTAHALIVLHKDSVKQCGCHWSRRR